MRLRIVAALAVALLSAHSAAAVSNPLDWCAGAGGDNSWQTGEIVAACDLNKIQAAHNATDVRVTALEAVDNIMASETTANSRAWLAAPTAANLRTALAAGVSGNGAVVFSAAPTLTGNSNLGTPLVLHLNNADLLPYTGITGMGAGVPTWLNDPSSANLLATLSTKTGTGLSVFDTAPTISSLVATTKINVPHVAADPAGPATGDTAVFTNASAIGSCDHTGAALTLCYYNGAAWVALGDGGAGGVSILDDLTDVVITAPATGATLVYDGAHWIDGPLNLADTDATTGDLPTSHFDSGTNADASHWLDGTGHWTIPAGAGTVTHTGATFVADELPCFADASGNVLKRCLAGAKLNSTGLTIAADAVDGQSLTLAEKTGNGSGVWKLTVGASNLPDATTTCTIDANGKIPSACMANGAVGFAGGTSDDFNSIITDNTGGGALVFAASPDLTGAPTTPTAAGSTDTTQIASTAQVHLAITNDVSPPPAFCAPYIDVLGSSGVGDLTPTPIWTFWRPGMAVHLTEIWCRSDSGTATIQLRKNQGVTDMFAAPLTCTSINGGIQNVFVASQDAINSTDYITVRQNGVGETQLTVCAKYTID